jgi:hypothetical protein
MVHLGSQAEFHKGGIQLVLRTYFSDGRYGYLVQNLYGGMPVARCEERFETPEEAMRKAEEVASRAVGDRVVVEWKSPKAIVSRSEASRIVNLPRKYGSDPKQA